jgi:predicted branched-subunit amino acid permease
MRVGCLRALGGYGTQCAVPKLPDSATSNTQAFVRGVVSAWLSVFSLVLFGTYIGMGALSHDFGFPPWWLALSSMLVWAAPAQVILISSLGSGASLIEAAVAVTLSAIRLLPMVVALLPLLRDKSVRTRDLILPTHFTSISMWVESLRLLPQIPRERRLPFCNGLSVGYMSTAVAAGFVGFYLAEGLPKLLAGALLFITPLSFLMSTARNARTMMDRLALILGLILGPLLTYYEVELDLMWTGVIGGALAYGVHRVREAVTQ